MNYLRYLRQNTAKISENKRKLGFKTVPPVQESVPGNVKVGRDSHEYCTPDTYSVFVACTTTGV